jgi:predicted nucleic acid-binding Zn ribbon protein
MPTYTYETLPDEYHLTDSGTYGAEVFDQSIVQARTIDCRFEVFQKMSDAPLKVHPETGAPVRRVITGGIGLKMPGLKRSTQVDKKSPAATACGCASSRSKAR